jgi:hypothetical protein
VIVEGQLLPNPDLKAAYEKIVWLYVYRDFSKSPEDLAAERVALRLGMTSYPQHLLVDPQSLEILADAGRSVESFLGAVGRAKAKRGEGAAARIREAEKRAEALEKSGSVAAARKALADEDIVVRYRAIQILSEKDPKAVAADAEALLATPNDPFRFEVCDALKKAADGQAARLLERIVAEPRDSLNPNVLRIRAGGALGACGDAESVKALAPFAAAADWRNGLTGVCVDAIAEIAKREKSARAAAKEALVAAYPKPAAEPSEARGTEALAKRVHAALSAVTGKKVDFPATYDAKARERLVKGW